MSLKDQFPIRVLVGGEDLTAFVDDGTTFANVDSGDGIGGYESCSLPFPMDLPQVLRGDHIRIDCGLGVAWEGRVKQVQRSLGSKTLIQGEGYAALPGDESGSMVFVDRDLTRWTDPLLARQLGLAAGGLTQGTIQVAADPANNAPALAEGITGPWSGALGFSAEALYDAGPENTAAKVYYNFTPNANISAADTNWLWEIYSTPDDVSFPESTGNLRAASGSGYFTPATARRYAMAQLVYGIASGGAVDYELFWHNLAVYGTHGLTGRGTDPVGFYPSDIAGWAAGQVPALQSGVIQLTDASGFIVPHSVYYDLVTLDQIITDMATISGWHAGVWESLSPLTGDPRPRFDFRARPAPGQFTAFCLRRDCDTLDLTEDLSQQYDECVVTFQNVDATDGAAIVTTDNPILDAAGINGRTLTLTGGTMTPASAALFAAEALTITNAQGRVSGSADIINAINGGTTAAWMLKSGIDRLRIGDVPSFDAFGALNDFPISRVECTLSSSGWTTAVELGSGADLVETLQARLTAASTLAQQGG